MIRTEALFDLKHTLAGAFLEGFDAPWQALDGLAEQIRTLGAALDESFVQVKPEVWVHKTAVVAPSVSLSAPCIIGKGTELRHGAFVRGSVLIGEGCVVGNSVEIKNALLFDGVQVSHFNYVGDSILGYKAHMGAGAVTSNVKLDSTNVSVRDADGTRIDTERMKLGALLGDFAEVGCNSVLNPGTVIGRHSTVYPLSCVRGSVPENHIHKNDGTIVPKHCEESSLK